MIGRLLVGEVTLYSFFSLAREREQECVCVRERGIETVCVKEIGEVKIGFDGVGGMAAANMARILPTVCV